jgi:hypothetical protein
VKPIEGREMKVLIESMHPTLNTVGGVSFNYAGRNGIAYCYKTYLDYSETEARAIKNRIINLEAVDNITID